MQLTAAHFPAAGRLKLSIYALALLGIASLADLEENGAILYVAIVAAIFAWAVVDSNIVWGAKQSAGDASRDVSTPPGRPLPKFVINLAVVIGALWFLWETLQRDDSPHSFVSALGYFIAILLMVKLFERKEGRDAGVIFLLAFLLVVSSTMYLQTMFHAFLVGAFFVLLAYAGVLVSLQHDMNSAARAASTGRVVVAPPPNGSGQASDVSAYAAAGGTGGSAGKARESSSRFVHDVRRMALRSAALLVPIAVIVFLMVPRTRVRPLLSNWGDSQNVSNVTGFTDVVEFHDYGQLTESDEVVMEVKLTQVGSSTDASYLDPYFRAVPLDHYLVRDRRWVNYAKDVAGDESAGELLNIPKRGLLQLYPSQDDAGDSGATSTGMVFQEYTLEIPTRYVFVMAPPCMIGNADFSVAYFNREDATLRLPFESANITHYTAASYSPGDPLVVDIPPGRPTLDGIPKEVIEVAKTVAGDRLPANGTLTPDEIRNLASTFENYLRINYPYSLEFRQVDRKLDQTADFLLNRKTSGGPCYYFASAMVMMCRSAGINARVVSGYHGGEYNSISERFVVRAKNAHAWAEYYVPGAGWILSDPSPISQAATDGESFVTRWVREMGQVIANMWNTAVVSFDNDTRTSVAQAVGTWMAQVKATVGEYLDAFVYATTGSANALTRVALWGPLAGLAIVGWWVIRRWRRDRHLRSRLLAGAKGRRRHAKSTADIQMLDELMRLVARRAGLPADHVRGIGQTPREFVEEHARALGEAIADARRVVEGFYAVHFGAKPRAAEIRAHMAQSLRRIKTVSV